MDQHNGVAGTIRHQPPVHRQGFAESAVLKRQVAQQLQRVVAPRAAKRLVDDPAEQSEIALARSLAKPALGQPVDPVAIDLPRLGRQLGDRGMAEPAVVHVQDEIARGIRAGSSLGSLATLSPNWSMTR